jgi:hypothetical protein
VLPVERKSYRECPNLHITGNFLSTNLHPTITIEKYFEPCVVSKSGRHTAVNVCRRIKHTLVKTGALFVKKEILPSGASAETKTASTAIDDVQANWKRVVRRRSFL